MKSLDSRGVCLLCPSALGFSLESAMACGILSVVGIYVAWAKLVFEPVEIVLSVRWPATLLASGIVFYQLLIRACAVSG